MAKTIEPGSIITVPPIGSTETYASFKAEHRDEIISALADSVKGLTHKTDEIKAGYMVSVDGNSSPKRIHATIDEAKAEAERMAVSQQGKIIRILYLVGVYEPAHKFRELV